MITKSAKKVVFLTNILPPYRLSVFRLLSKSYSEFKVLLSANNEKNRSWKINTSGIDVEIQKNISLIGNNKHPIGFDEKGTIHIPFDTVTKLFTIKPDVIVTAEFGLRTLFASVYKLFIPKSKFIVYADLSEHTEGGRGVLRRLIRKYILLYASSVIVNGSAGERYIRNTLKYKGNIFKVPYPSDSVFIENHNVKNNVVNDVDGLLTINLLYVGQLISRKGIIQFVKQLEEYSSNKQLRFNLILVGDGDLKDNISSLSSDKISIKCKGQIEYSELFKFYLKTDISILPTLADTWALVVNESMSCGVPVLGSKYSQAAEEMINHRHNGWLYDPLSKEGFSNVMDEITVDVSSKLDEISSNAHETAKNISANYVSLKMIDAING